MTLKHLILAKIAGTAMLAAAGTSGTAFAEATPYLGAMTMVGEPFCPRGWAHMDGQLLPINSNSALFSLLGCTFGGDCRNTFALPDMRGRTPVGIDPSSGVYRWGSRGGRENVSLTSQNLPRHNHAINASDRPGTSSSPTGKDLADFTGTLINGYTSSPPDGGPMATNTIGNAGSSQSFNIRQPYQVINYCIAMVGTYPSRN